MPKQNAGATGRLTDKEWQFCHELVYYGCKVKALDKAYLSKRHRSRAKKAYLADRIMNRPRVISEIDRMTGEAQSQAKLTLVQHMQELEGLRDGAKDAGQWAAATRCEELRGKVAGFYFDRHHITIENTSMDDVTRALKDLMLKYPEMVPMAPGPPLMIESTSSPAFQSTSDCLDQLDNQEAQELLDMPEPLVR